MTLIAPRPLETAAALAVLTLCVVGCGDDASAPSVDAGGPDAATTTDAAPPLDAADTGDAVTTPDDDCVAGAFCSVIGQPMGGTFRCRKICLRSTDCASGEGCHRFSDATSPERFGACIPACTPFGTDCPAGTHCKRFGTADPEGVVFVCLYPGADRTTGAPCGTAYDCGDDSACIRSPPTATEGTCRAGCDASHACTTGTCTPTGEPTITADGSSPGYGS